jgi:hypothetical protein
MAENRRSGRLRADLAYLWAQLGKKRWAESEIAQALQQSPNDNETRRRAAVAYEVLGRRSDTLSVLAASSNSVLLDLSRWPEVADLHRDSRFTRLLNSSSRLHAATHWN